MKKLLIHTFRLAVMLLSAFLGLMLVVFVLVEIPAVRENLIRRSEALLEERLGTRVDIARVDIDFPAVFSMKQLVVSDQQDVEFIKVRDFRVNAISVSFWDFILRPQDKKDISVGSVRVVGPDIFLYKRTCDSVLNAAFIADAFDDGDTTESPDMIRLNITTLRIQDGHFRWVDSVSVLRDSVRPGYVNYHNLDIDSLETDLSARYEGSENFDLQLARVSLREQLSGFKLDHLSCTATTEKSSLPDEQKGTLLLNDLSLRQGNTWIKADFRFPGQTITDIFDSRTFRYEAQLSKDNRLDFSSLDYFLTQKLPVKGIVYAEGPVSGNANLIESPGLGIRYLDDTRIFTALTITHPTSDVEAVMTARIDDSQISFRELAQMLPGVTIPAFMQALAPLKIEGAFDGHFYDFQSQVKAVSEWGNVQADLHLSMPPLDSVTSYQGTISTENLNINALSLEKTKISEHLTLSGTLSGKGTELNTLVADADLSLHDSDLFGYAVDTLHTVAHLDKGKLTGQAQGSDGQGEADLLADLDLLASPASYALTGFVHHLNLATYGIYDQPLLFSTGLDMQINGDSLDDLRGQIQLEGAEVANPRQKTKFTSPQVVLSAENTKTGLRHITLQSDFADIDLSGYYKVQQAAEGIGRIAKETEIYLSNNDSLVQAYYAAKPVDLTELSLDIGIEVKDSLNSLFRFIGEPLYVSPGSTLGATLTYSPGLLGNEQLSLMGNIDSVRYGSNGLRGVTADLSLAKYNFANMLMASGGVTSQKLSSGSFHLDGVDIQLDGSDNGFVIDLKSFQPEVPARFQFKINTRVFPGKSIRNSIDSRYSYAMVRSDSLTLLPNDSIIFENGEVRIENLMFENNDRYLRIHGEISEREESVLNVSLAQLDLSILPEFYPLDYRPGGKLNVDLRMSRLLSDPQVNLISRVDNFTLEDYPYGQVYIRGDWQQSVGDVHLRANLLDKRDTTLQLKGIYSLSDSISPLDFRLMTQKDFPLNFIEPFVEGELYGIQGEVELKEFSITGNFSNLIVNGSGRFKQAGFGVDYFKTSYTFDGDIFFDNDRIRFPRITLYDKNRNHADLHGVIRHRGLQEFTFDLQLDKVRNFLMMDTQKKDNDLFYGSLYLKDGIADITGNLDNIIVQAVVSTGTGTRLRIPLMEYSEYGRPDYIEFQGEKKDKKQEAEKLQGFELSLTAIITEEAEVELIFNERVGDIIRGRGQGDITMNVNERGDFTMYGDYEITQGDYLFTSQNVINKKFGVRPGGRITWDGDAYAAKINMDAVYPLNADISALLSTQSDGQARRVPVNVMMNLKGMLFQPEIALSIELPNLNLQEASIIASQLKSIQYDEQELNKQVFSLMMFNRFAPIGGFDGGQAVTQGVTTSISEMLSNQLSYWLSQATNNKVNVGVNTSNFQDVSLLISATLFNDRVKIERNGTLVNSNSSFSVGNISLIIRLLPTQEQISASGSNDRELVLEVFNRESITNAQDLGITSYQTGIGIFYKRDFDKIAELFKKQQMPDN